MVAWSACWRAGRITLALIAFAVNPRYVVIVTIFIYVHAESKWPDSKRCNTKEEPQ